MDIPKASGLPTTATGVNAINKPIGTFTVAGLEIQAVYWQALVVVFLIFLLILTFARLRHIYVGWSIKGFIPAVFFGVLLTLLVEGLFLVSGRTIITQIFGIRNAPKPISTALDEGKVQLMDVLGVSDEVKDCVVPKATIQTVMWDYNQLSEKESDSVKDLICGK